jgi:diketogulonate reductase-like aldo/keto reductase
MYRNEKQVGHAITDLLSSPANTSGLKREDIHYTTKLASNTEYATARKSITKSVKESGLGYVDLFLLHSPYGGKTSRLESWKAIEDAIDAGEIRMGGVSNYGIKHLQELFDSKPRHRPVVNQIEVHPFNTRSELCEFCASQDLVVEAYAPLARAMRMSHPTIRSLAEKYETQPGTLMVRWSCQKGYVPLPKSVNQDRIRANGAVEGFEISKEDMKTLDGLDEYLVTDWDPVDAP